MNCNLIAQFSVNINVPSRKADRFLKLFTNISFGRSSPDVNQLPAGNASYETTTCDELDNPDHSRHKRSARRRK